MAFVLASLRYSLRLLLCLCLVGGALALQATPARAASCSTRSAAASQQPPANHAGLVVDFGDGRVQTFCIDLGEDGEATGEEVLRASNLPLILEYTGGNGIGVCKIGDVGTNFPAEPCFAPCSVNPNEGCPYWAYWHLVNDQWTYSQKGLSSWKLHAGDVDGWAWSKSGGNQTTRPALRTFASICQAVTPTASATATPTNSPTPLPTATLYPTQPPGTYRLPTPTPIPTNTPLATATSTAVAAVSATTQPPTSLPSATPAPTTSPSATRALPSSTAAPSAPTTEAAMATTAPLAPTAPAATATDSTIAQAPIQEPDAGMREVYLPLLQQPEATQAVATPAPDTPAPSVLTATPTLAPVATATPPVATNSPARNYPYFGMLALLLGGAWLWLRRGRGKP